jgi:hypothetical protein
MPPPSLWNACKQHAMGCHLHPLGFMFCNSFARAFQRHHFVAFFFGVVATLWSFNYLNTTSMPLWIPWWSNFSTLILHILFNHKVDVGVSVLLLSSFNISCHGIAPRFKVCVFPSMFANTLLWNWPIMYLLTFVKVLLLGVQLDQKYLVEI